MVFLPKQFATRAGITALIVVVCAMGSAEQPKPKAAKPGLPPFSALRQAAALYFQKQLPQHRAGDLITRDQVEPLVKQLAEMGFAPADTPKILAAIPVKGEFLAEQLRTPTGKAFMRDMSGYPGGYDRLDRLSRLPHGKRTIRDLIKGPDGYKMIEYMTETPGGKELGEQLANAPLGKDFNDPTGRIYTAEALVERLRQSHAAMEKTAAKNKAR